MCLGASVIARCKDSGDERRREERDCKEGEQCTDEPPMFGPLHIMWHFKQTTVWHGQRDSNGRLHVRSKVPPFFIFTHQDQSNRKDIERNRTQRKGGDECWIAIDLFRLNRFLFHLVLKFALLVFSPTRTGTSGMR